MSASEDAPRAVGSGRVEGALGQWYNTARPRAQRHGGGGDRPITMGLLQQSACLAGAGPWANTGSKFNTSGQFMSASLSVYSFRP